MGKEKRKQCFMAPWTKTEELGVFRKANAFLDAQHGEGDAGWNGTCLRLTRARDEWLGSYAWIRHFYVRLNRFPEAGGLPFHASVSERPGSSSEQFRTCWLELNSFKIILQAVTSQCAQRKLLSLWFSSEW